MFAAFTNFQRSFASDERGSVAIIFAMLLIVLAFTAGIAIDTARIYHDKSSIARAVDSATLASGQSMLDGRNSDADVEAVALAYFYENLKSSGIKKSEISVDKPKFNRATGEVSFTVKTAVEMTLTRVMGYDKVDFPVAAKAVFDSTDIELGLALDITGSMTGQKLKDLKEASNELLDIMMPKGGTSYKVRIGLAPYAASINAGSYAATVSNSASTDNCVWERTGPQAFTDAAPAAGSYLSGGEAPVDIDPTEGTSDYSCPNTSVIPLTDNKDTLETAVKGLKAKGYTAGHLGAAWASYLVSPEWASIWPASATPVDYSNEETVKAVIFMTDGIFNTAYANGNSDYQALEVCDAMKANDVKVYTIGFAAPSGAETTLKACATDEDHYFDASNGTELKAAFVSIAKQLTNLRLTN